MSFNEAGFRPVGFAITEYIGDLKCEYTESGYPLMICESETNNCQTMFSTIRIQPRINEQVLNLTYVNMKIRSGGNYGGYFRLTLVKNGLSIFRKTFFVPNPSPDIISVALDAPVNLTFGSWIGVQIQAINDIVPQDFVSWDNVASGVTVVKGNNLPYNGTVHCDVQQVRSDNFGALTSIYQPLPYFMLTQSPEGTVLDHVVDDSACPVSTLITEENVDAGGDGSDGEIFNPIPPYFKPNDNVSEFSIKSTFHLGDYLSYLLVGGFLLFGGLTAYGVYELTKDKRKVKK